MRFKVKDLLNLTMYRRVLYLLLFLLFLGIIFNLTGRMPYDYKSIIFTTIALFIICNAFNLLLAKIFNAKTNFESATITSLILALVSGPFSSIERLPVLLFLGVAAMGSKYLIAYNKKHIFNPAVLAIMLTGILLNMGASWWIEDTSTVIFIILGGLWINYKIKRLEMVFVFLAIYFVSVFLRRGFDISLFLAPSVWFFTLVMLVEPLTSPSTKKNQIIFSTIVGFSYVLMQYFLPTFPYRLETSLLIGNIYAFVAVPSFNTYLIFNRKEQAAKNTWTFYFTPSKKFNFIPGQFLEWTLPHKKLDARGVRRYFTIASSPKEELVSVTMRIFENSSSFKNALLKMNEGDVITVSNPLGSFVLPHEKSEKLAFLAGGIGVTPFRSMVKHLLDENEKRDILMIYSNKTEEEAAFKNLFSEAESVGLKTVYVNTDADGFVDENKIKDEIPDYKERVFYLSGPEPMVKAFKQILSKLGVKGIKTDYFTGY